VTWDKPQEKMVDCPGCREKIKEGAIVHAVPYCGYVFDWETAVERGLRTQEQWDVAKKARKPKEI